jgi:hypothetical protein
MYAHYALGTTTMRELAADDVGGICTIYLPDGERVVDKSVSSTGTIDETTCDPTPRHGFSTQCAQPKSKGCDVSGAEAPAGGGNWAVGAALALAACAGIGIGKRRRAA